MQDGRSPGTGLVPTASAHVFNLQFQLMTCPSSDAVPRLRAHTGGGLLQLVLMDHDVGQYLADLLALEQEGLMAPGCVLLFNNTQLPAARALLEHVGSRPETYTICREIHGLLELQRHLLDTSVPGPGPGII